MNSKDNIEMKEIKVSKGKALLRFLDRHIIALYIIVVLAISLYGCVAKAHELPDDAYSDVVSFYDAHFSSSYKEYFLSCLEQCPYFVHFHYYVSYNERYFIILYSHEDMGYNFISNTGNVNGSGNSVYRVVSGVRQYSTAFTRNSDFNLGNSGRIVMFYSMRTNMTPFISNVNISAFASDWRVRPASSYALVTSQNEVAGNNFNIGRNTFNDITSFGNVYIQTALDEFVYHETDYTSYAEDSRLKFAKINSTYDGEVLMTDIRQFIKDYPIQDTSHSSVSLDPESITITYTVGNIEKTITLNSSNSTIRSKYIFETPIYQFDFDDDNSSVIITKADFTISGTSQSAPYDLTQSYKILCNYPIRQLSPLPIPTPISDPTYNDVSSDVEDPSTVLQEITSQLTNDSTTTNAFTGEWTLDQEHPTVPSWADSYDFRVIKSDFNSIISGVVNKDIWNYYTSNDPNDYDWITGGFNPRNFVDDNRNFAFYDMIIISVYEANIAWDPDNVGTNLIYQNIHLLGYITLYSQRYYVHKSAITDNNILATLEYSSLNDVAFFDTIKATVDQFEQYTLGRLDAGLDIDKESLSWLKTIDNSIKALEPFDDSSILDILDNIYDAISGWGGTDTSNIEAKLDTLINHFIANNSQENTAYKRFVTWLRDINGKPVQYVTTGYDFFTELFDYFPFTKDLDGAGGFTNVFDMGKGFIDLSTGHTTGIPEHYQSLSYYFNSANDGSYNVSSMSGR